MDLRQLLRALADQGFRVDQTERGHYRAFARDGKGLVVIGGNHATADPRAIRNALSQLRKIGFVTR